MSARDYAEKWAVYYDYRDSRKRSRWTTTASDHPGRNNQHRAEERIPDLLVPSIGRALALPLLLTCEWRIVMTLPTLRPDLAERRRSARRGWLSTR